MTSPTVSAAEASRFLTQATFGPSDASIQSVASSGFNNWISSQISAPLNSLSHEAYVQANINAAGDDTPSVFFRSWWRQAVSSPDQLRQRVAFALSQIFVISLNDPVVNTVGAASYYDMLQRDAFGNFRTLLEDVTMHPMMGEYLTYLANQKEDPAGTRKPDENYAREVMQLMTIGLWELNADGTQKLNNAAPIPTYGPDDIAGLAKVFTGISWYHPTPTNNTFFGSNNADGNITQPMIFYPNYHSTSAKTFLGTTIPANSSPDVGAELDIALDRLFNHDNAAPFFAKRMIQQLVTSNPTPAYVGRVAAVFANNGAGVRGDIAAVVRAILTDAEARDTAAAQANASFGKLREPVIRLANWARAFEAGSTSGLWQISSTSANTSLNQSAMAANSVFNFWRPGFTPPATTQVGQRNLVAPEFQIVDEVTVASYVNLMEQTIDIGIGNTPSGASGPDVQADYSKETTIAHDAAALVDRINLLLFYGQMPQRVRDIITAQVNDVAMPSNGSASLLQERRLIRSMIAIFFSMTSPEYLIQR